MTMRIAASFPACASVLVAFLALGAAPARSADSSNAFSAFERGDYSTALSEFRALARKGDPYSQYNVAVFYADDGLGVAKNYEESVKWYRKAAGQGHAEAQFRLSLMYIYGYGVDANRTLARHWLERAAEQGHRDSQQNLGFMYRAGRGVDRDDAKAAYWYRQAAEQGSREAQAVLGVMYAKGEGLPKDLTRAQKWLERAADRGHGRAQNDLMYLRQGGKYLASIGTGVSFWDSADKIAR